MVPAHLRGGNKDERKPPTEMELREAQKIGGSPARAAEEKPAAPKRKSLFGN